MPRIVPRNVLVYEQIKSFLRFPPIPSIPSFIIVQPRPATALQLRSGRSRVGPGQVRSAGQCQYNSHQLYTSACCIARPLARWAGYVASAPQESDLMQQSGRTGEAKGRVRGRRFEQDYYGGNLIPLTSSARTLLVALLCPSALSGMKLLGPARASSSTACDARLMLHRGASLHEHSRPRAGSPIPHHQPSILTCASHVRRTGEVSFLQTPLTIPRKCGRARTNPQYLLLFALHRGLANRYTTVGLLKGCASVLKT